MEAEIIDKFLTVKLTKNKKIAKNDKKCPKTVIAFKLYFYPKKFNQPKRLSATPTQTITRSKIHPKNLHSA